MEKDWKASAKNCKSVINARKNYICHIWRYLDKAEEKYGVDLTAAKDALTSAVQDLERAMAYLEAGEGAEVCV